MWYRETGRLFFLFHSVLGSFFFFAGAMMRLEWIAPLRVIPPPFYFLPVCIFVVRVTTRCVFCCYILRCLQTGCYVPLSPLFTSCFYTTFTIIIGHAITTQHHITSTNYRKAHTCSNEKCQIRYNYLTKMKMK
jgi:hypothetical protein